MANTPELNFSDFRKNLDSLFKSRGWSNAEAADRMEISRSAISRYMANKRDPELKYIVQIAQFFDVSIDWLLGFSEDPRNRFTDETVEIATLYSLASPDDRSVIQAVLNKYRSNAK